MYAPIVEGRWLAAEAPNRVTKGGDVSNGKAGQPIRMQQHNRSAHDELQSGPQHGHSGGDSGERGEQQQERHEQLRARTQMGGGEGSGAYWRRGDAATAGPGSSDGISGESGTGSSSSATGNGGGISGGGISGGVAGGKARRLVATSAAFLVSGIAHELILL